MANDYYLGEHHEDKEHEFQTPVEAIVKKYERIIDQEERDRRMRQAEWRHENIGELDNVE